MPARQAGLRLALALAGLAMLLAGCEQIGAGIGGAPASGPARFALKPATFDQLSGWAEDTEAAAIPAFLRSCKAFLAKADSVPIDEKLPNGDFGTVGEWREPCAAAMQLPGSDSAAKVFFESNFAPMLVVDGDEAEGLFTGYFEIVLNGSRRREGPYQTPLYRQPPGRITATRAEIEDGALAGKGLELLWVDDPVGAFFLAIEGSGQIRLADGSTVRVGYAGSNGQKFLPIGRLLIERGEMPREKVTMQSLREWIATHGDAGRALMREDPSYVFFQEQNTDGAVGTGNIVLTAGRSLAVDRAHIPLGVPLWIDVRQRFAVGSIRRLVIAQDTGGAIKGVVRGDLFWGSGEAAGQTAGTMNARGRYFLLLPKAVAARWSGRAGQ